MVPDRLKADTVLYKKLIAGVLVALQKQTFEYLELLDSGDYSHDQVMEILQFVQRAYSVRIRKRRILKIPSWQCT